MSLRGPATFTTDLLRMEELIPILKGIVDDEKSWASAESWALDHSHMSSRSLGQVPLTELLTALRKYVTAPIWKKAPSFPKNHENIFSLKQYFCLAATLTPN